MSDESSLAGAAQEVNTQNGPRPRAESAPLGVTVVTAVRAGPSQASGAAITVGAE